MKILYISPKGEQNNSGGLQTRMLNKKIIESLFPGTISYGVLLNKPLITKMLNNLFGFKNGMTFLDIIKILSLIRKKTITHVFIDTSLYGKCVKIIKNNLPFVKIIVFYHNCEYKIYSDLLGKMNSFIRKLIIKPIIFNERACLMYANKNIFLSQRDYNDCLHIYKISNKVDYLISPMAVCDKNIVSQNNKIVYRLPNILLFVGSYFFPNINGLLWFDKYVLSKIDYSLIIVGKNFEKKEFTKRLINTNKIICKGYIEEIELEYINADCVIQPVFEGSGMKTKTAECLMFGKPIISTTEGLSGYNCHNTQYIYRCDNAADFIETLSNLKKQKMPSYVIELRRLFLELYSMNAKKYAYRNYLEME